MAVTGFVIADSALLNALLRHIQIDHDPPVLRNRSRERAQLERVERTAGIASAGVREKIAGVVCENNIHTAESAL